MSPAAKLPHGSVEWFEMVGRVMCEAASQANLPPDLNWSLVERYSDGTKLPNGRLQGLRFDLVASKPVFRAGVDIDEQGDVTIEVSAAVAHVLNRLPLADPAYALTYNRALDLGDIRITGDLSSMAGWLAAAHDPIVERTGEASGEGGTPPEAGWRSRCDLSA
ncbi:hypothetical protein [Radicibacter daui]|uniref:hypothetical protein n=1 Tax=Radicibacter daui TaxID=3064829 RepID=UPI004046CB01